LHGAVGDLGDLEVGIDLSGDAHELALALEEGDPVAEIPHECLLRARSQWVSWPSAITDRKTSPTTSIERTVFRPSYAAVPARRSRRPDGSPSGLYRTGSTVRSANEAEDLPNSHQP